MEEPSVHGWEQIITSISFLQFQLELQKPLKTPVTTLWSLNLPGQTLWIRHSVTVRSFLALFVWIYEIYDTDLYVSYIYTHIYIWYSVYFHSQCTQFFIASGRHQIWGLHALPFWSLRWRRTPHAPWLGPWMEMDGWPQKNVRIERRNGDVLGKSWLPCKNMIFMVKTRGNIMKHPQYAFNMPCFILFHLIAGLWIAVICAVLNVTGMFLWYPLMGYLWIIVATV